MSAILAFVAARLDDNDWRAAAVIVDARTIRRCGDGAKADRYEAEARWVLRDIAAKRAILDAYEAAKRGTDIPRRTVMRDLGHASAMGAPCGPRDGRPGARRDRLRPPGLRPGMGCRVSGYVLGTGYACDFRITDEYVSTEHARVWWDAEGAAWVEDMGSTNGTFVQRGGHGRPRVRVIGPALLCPGDVLWLGLRTWIPWTWVPWTAR